MKKYTKKEFTKIFEECKKLKINWKNDNETGYRNDIVDRYIVDKAEEYREEYGDFTDVETYAEMDMWGDIENEQIDKLMDTMAEIFGDYLICDEDIYIDNKKIKILNDGEFEIHNNLGCYIFNTYIISGNKTLSIDNFDNIDDLIEAFA